MILMQQEYLMFNNKKLKKYSNENSIEIFC